MGINAFKLYCLGFIILLSSFLIGSCSSSSANFRREYRMVWKETIKSQAWKNSINAGQTSTSSENIGYYSSTDVGVSAVNNVARLNTDAGFIKKYHSLVTRAYFKIIAEAEKADSRLKEEYERLNSEKQEVDKRKDKPFKNNLTLVNKRYHAHREMLEGLKSWNIFSEYRSDDLDFFKEENVKDVYEMYQNGQNEEGIISFLVFKLADLYHFAE